MRSFNDRAKVARVLVLGFIGVGAWCAGHVAPALAGEDRSDLSEKPWIESGTASQQPKAVDASKLTPGMMIYIDPQTGTISTEPAPGTVPLQLTPKLLDALSTSDQGLVEVPSPALGGGVFIDLQGRFQTPLFAIIGPDGTVKIRHLHETPEAGKQK